MCFIFCYCIQFTTTDFITFSMFHVYLVNITYFYFFLINWSKKCNSCIYNIHVLKYIPFLDIQKSFGEWIVFNFESSNLKQQIADVIQCHYAYHCSFVDMFYKITLQKNKTRYLFILVGSNCYELCLRERMSGDHSLWTTNAHYVNTWLIFV